MSVRISRTHVAAPLRLIHSFGADGQANSSTSLVDISQKLPTSSDFRANWLRHAQTSNFRKVTVVETDPDGSTFDDLATYLRRHPEAREEVRDITLAGAPHTHARLLTDVLSKVLTAHPLPNLQSLTIRDLTLLHFEDPGLAVADSIRLHQLSLENIGDLTAAGILWILRHFAQIDYLSLRGVGVVQQTRLYRTNEQASNLWHIFDVSQLNIPSSLEVTNLDVQGVCSCAFYLNVMRCTPSMRSLKRINASCSRTDDLIALGGLVGELGAGLQSLSVGISDCSRFGVNVLQDPEIVHQHIAKLQLCTSLQNFGIEFYLSPNNFPMNSSAWLIVSKFLSYVPLSTIEAVSLNFFAGNDANLSYPAIGQLNWLSMRDILNRFVIPRQPSVTIFANTGFEDTQIEYILQQLPELADSEALYINGCEDTPTDIYDEVAMKMMDYESDSDVVPPSEDDSEVVLSAS